jgi:hypothetical protein
MNHVMLDLETLGTRPGSVIVAIGAVQFDAQDILSEFYREINIQDSLSYGFQIDGETLRWWFRQSKAAQAAILSEHPASLVDTLQDFALWIPKDSKVWGNGAAFDNALLAEAYHKTGMAVPWKYKHDRCFRTMADRSSVPPMYEGTAHHALDDARGQARRLMAIWRENAQQEIPV